jgi:hypothetical protein
LKKAPQKFLLFRACGGETGTAQFKKKKLSPPASLTLRALGGLPLTPFRKHHHAYGKAIDSGKRRDSDTPPMGP